MRLPDLQAELLALPDDVRRTAHVFDNGEVAWKSEDAAAAINALADEGRVVLGLDARRLYPDGGVVEMPVSALRWQDAEREDERVERGRREALAALPRAVDEGTHVLVTWA
jgi:hypothetical protein